MASTSREEQLMQAREMDRVSTAMINFGTGVVKRNPIKVGAYLLGILVCLFFNGMKVTDMQRNEYYKLLDTIDHASIDSATEDLHYANQAYRQSKGWFSCDANCQLKKADMEGYQKIFNQLRADQDNKLAEAKSKLGLFSEHGVAETRDLFWLRLSQGKGFATRQTKWDALFMGMSAMGRDEKLVSYLLRLAMSMIFNFTLGIFGAVVGFVFSLMSLIQTYQASLPSALAFFTFATIAAVSFGLTWLFGLYIATAGTVYVGAKLIASNMRIENGRGGGYQQRRRME